MHKVVFTGPFVIDTIKRLGTSVNGNPRYRVTFTNGNMHDTQSNSMCNYGILNSEYNNGHNIDVAFSKSGRITHIRQTESNTQD